MITAILKIRLKQIARETIGLGLFRILFLLILFSFLAFMLFKATETSPNSYFALLIHLVILIYIQLKRKDITFLKCHFSNFKLVFLIEYLILCTPLIALQIFHTKWIDLTLVMVALFFIIHLQLAKKTIALNTKFQQLIITDSFEWKSGIRKMLLFVMPLWIVSLFTSFYIASVPIAIFILGLIPLNFYEKGEPVQMLLSFELGAKKFLARKIKIHLILFGVLTLPLILGFIIFHPSLWYIPFIELFLFASLHIYNLLSKYAFYEPNTKSPAVKTYNAIGMLGVFLPFFLPIIWLMAAWFYIQSIDKLNFYLNDYN